MISIDVDASKWRQRAWEIEGPIASTTGKEIEIERESEGERVRDMTVTQCRVFARKRIGWCSACARWADFELDFSSYSFVAMAPASALCDVWMKSKRIRQRFAKGHSFVQFPAVEEGKPENTMSTMALAMNSRTLLGMAKHYRVLSGKKVPIVNLQKAVPCQVIDVYILYGFC